MKKTMSIVTFILCLVFLICVCKNIERGIVYIDYTNSYLSSFKIDDDIVYFSCYITVINNYNTDVKIMFYAKSQRDYDAGLLKSPVLVTETNNGEDAIFVIPPNSKDSICITFSGQHGENNIKSDRLLPDLTLVELR